MTADLHQLHQWEWRTIEADVLLPDDRRAVRVYYRPRGQRVNMPERSFLFTPPEPGETGDAEIAAAIEEHAHER